MKKQFNQYNKEYLYHSLTDYISMRIKDSDLISEIENEIRNNPDFKCEYEELRETFEFLDQSEFSDPGENYFSSLSARINQRVHKEIVPHAGFIERFRIKFVLPVLATAAVITIGIFYVTGSRDTDPVKKSIPVTQSDVNKTGNLNQQQTETRKLPETENSIDHVRNLTHTGSRTHAIHKSEIQNVQQPVQVRDAPSKSDVPAVVNSGTSQNVTLEQLEKKSGVSEVADIESDVESYIATDPDDEDFDYEIQKLLPEEQKELIDNLSKTQI